MSDYILLPFQFKYFDNSVLLVNQVGEYTFLEQEDFTTFYNGRLDIASDIYKKLKGQHFLTVESEKDFTLKLLSIKLRTKKAFITDFTSLHMIVVTLRCNCSCNYCHASSVDLDTKNYDMNWDTAKKTIDMIFQTPSNDIKIEYQGGEPTLNWDILEQSVLYAKFLNKFAKKKLGFVICTNLLSITEKQLSFCKEHSIELSTSLDGTKEIHDKNRKSRIDGSTYDTFITNSKIVKEKLGENGCSPLLTITSTNINKLRSVIDEYVKLGYNTIFLRALNPYGNAVKNKNDLSYSIDEFVNAYKD